MPIERLLALPRAELGHWPTPLHRLDRFGDAIGAEVWCKRDDIQGVALAGNKVRKFELAIGRAITDGCDTLVTAGAVQSNSARTGAAAAAAAGLRCILLLSGDRPATAGGNLLLDELLGADVRFAGDVGWVELNQGVDRIVEEVDASGGRAFAAPVGCSSPLGTLGFAIAFLELDRQLEGLGLEPAAIVHTSTSGGTHAGLLVGRALTGRDVRIIAVDAAAMYGDQPSTYAELAALAGALIGLDPAIHPGAVEVVDSQLGPGYGRPNEATRRAIDLLAETEAIVTDPVYSGKGAAGLIELVQRRSIDGPVVFWHTGGYHALFDPSVAASLTG